MTPPPPHSGPFSKEQRQALDKVQSDIWRNGIVGMATGSLSGIGLYAVTAMGRKSGLWKLNGVSLNRNTAFLSFLLGGAVGSFVMAVTKGKNEAHNLHSVFQGNKPKTHDLSYQEQLELAKQNGDGLKRLKNYRTEHKKDGALLPFEERELSDAEERLMIERNRMYRRATIAKSFEEGHGLSDAHGGHWVNEKK